jgi:flagellar biosynthetic protein FliS
LPAFDYPDPCERNTVVHNNLQRAVDIIRELNSALDMEAGGQLAITLRNLYVYFEQRLLESNRHKRREETREVIGHLKELREAWAAMLTGQGQIASDTNVPELAGRLDLRAT